MLLWQHSSDSDCTPVAESTYDADGEAPSNAIVDALATAEGIDPMKLEPLYDSLDVEALDRLFGNRDDESQLVLSYPVGEWTVFVRGDGHVFVCDCDDSADDSADDSTDVSVACD